ncbi:MAG TPA: hypothetical protein VIF36_02025 [Gaiellaceae bacterium]
MDERGKRIGQNEVIFREVNERLRELGESFSVLSELAEFVCECGDTSCTERVQMRLSDYEGIRSDPKWFLVVKGHDEPDYERVIEEREAYAVVEKLPGGPAEIAISDDPRSAQR